DGCRRGAHFRQAAFPNLKSCKTGHHSRKSRFLARPRLWLRTARNDKVGRLCSSVQSAALKFIRPAEDFTNLFLGEMVVVHSFGRIGAQFFPNGAFFAVAV